MRHARAARQHLVETQHGGDRQRRRRLCIGEERSPAGSSMVSFFTRGCRERVLYRWSDFNPKPVPSAGTCKRVSASGRRRPWRCLRRFACVETKRVSAFARAGRIRRRENVVCAALLS